MRGPLDPKLRKELLRKVKAQFRLDLRGEHGTAHWMRVRENGMRLCAQVPMADKVVVELFALLHDSQRVSEGYDPEHGKRAAAYAADLGLPITSEQLSILFVAIQLHSDGVVSPPMNVSTATMGVCWDADRLDLNRPGVNIVPQPTLMSTDAARSMLAWSMARSRRGFPLIHKGSILRHTLPDPASLPAGAFGEILRSHLPQELKVWFDEAAEFTKGDIPITIGSTTRKS